MESFPITMECIDRNLTSLLKNILAGKAIGWSQPMYYCINLDTWNKLPEDVQQGILRASENTEKTFSEMYEAEFDRIVEAEKKEQDVRCSFIRAKMQTDGLMRTA
ncbi:hypothetical protein [Acetomicrobium sp.]|uniref:hypothetical protein n=1 Tax=Acetomicrobium sp. TaxID=1872099 RepID=UPI002FC7F86C